MIGADLDVDFNPAASLAEGAAQIGALTGAAPERTRGEKRVLLALRDALDVDVPTVATSAVLGAALADQLGIPWYPTCYVDKTSLTLAGVNALLHGASLASQRGALRAPPASESSGLTGLEWADFQPAVSKIEAVTRISALTGSGPERLGPGSKEHKRVLTNLATKLLPEIDQRGMSKTRLAGAIARELGVPWGDQFISTGETIRLSGLNVILAGAERKTGRLGLAYAAGLTPEDEGAALIDALWHKLLRPNESAWDAREKTEWLRDEGTRQENQMEWPGHYFEHRGRQVLSSSFRPNPDSPRTLFGNTRFDYSLNHVWDLKAHTAEQLLPVSGAVRAADGEAILNDAEAVMACVEGQGLGFLVLSGRGVMDEDGAFKAWHDAFKGKPATPSLSGNSRLRKASFVPLVVEAFWIPNREAFDEAVRLGALRIASQGRQQSGAPRRDKIHMRLEPARRLLRVAERAW